MWHVPVFLASVVDSLHHIFIWYPIILFSLARLQLTSPELKAIAKCYRLYPQIRLAAKKFWSALGGQFIIYYKWKAKFMMTNCTSHIFSCLYMSYIHMHELVDLTVRVSASFQVTSMHWSACVWRMEHTCFYALKGWKLNPCDPLLGECFIFVTKLYGQCAFVRSL